MSLQSVLGYVSGLHWVAPNLDLPTLIGTTTALHICDGIMCRLFAHNKGYPKNLSTALGATLGIWAVAVLIALPRRATAPPP